MNPMLLNSYSNTYLGHTGSPYYSNDFFQRVPFDDFMFKSYYKAYLTFPEDINYYNTKKPFAKVDYSTNTVKKMANENLHVLYTQNVNRDLNVGLDYRIFSNYGQYTNQRLDNQNITAFSCLKKERYEYFFNISDNINQEV